MIRFLIIVVLIIVSIMALVFTYYPNTKNIERLGQFSPPFNMYNNSHINPNERGDYIPYVNYKKYPKLNSNDKNYSGFSVYSFIPQFLRNKLVEKMGNFMTHANTIDYDTVHNHIDSHVTFDKEKEEDVSPNQEKPSWSSFSELKADREDGNNCSKLTDPGEKEYCEMLNKDLKGDKDPTKTLEFKKLTDGIPILKGYGLVCHSPPKKNNLVVTSKKECLEELQKIQDENPDKIIHGTYLKSATSTHVCRYGMGSTVEEAKKDCGVKTTDYEGGPLKWAEDHCKKGLHFNNTERAGEDAGCYIIPQVSGTMPPGDILKAGERIYSPKGDYFLIMQGDGNLVLYKEGGEPAIWSSKTRRVTEANRKDGELGQPERLPHRAVFQEDDNFVIYDKSDKPQWDTKTNGKKADRLVVQDDGNLVMYDGGGTPIWASNSQQK